MQQQAKQPDPMQAIRDMSKVLMQHGSEEVQSEFSRLMNRDRRRVDVDEHGILRPKTDDQIEALAQKWFESGSAPKTCNNWMQLAVMLAFGIEAGLTASQCLRSMMIVNNVPSIWGDGALALVRNSELCHSVTEYMEGSGDSTEAVCRCERYGRRDADEREVIERRFSVGQAKNAGLWGKPGPWKQYPRRMLQMRARAWALRDGFPDVLMGLSITEEVSDFDAGTSRRGTSAPSAASLDAELEAAKQEASQKHAPQAPQSPPEPEHGPDDSVPAEDPTPAAGLYQADDDAKPAPKPKAEPKKREPDNSKFTHAELDELLGGSGPPA